MSTEKVSILSIYDRLSFAILPCSMAIARDVIWAQSAAWNHQLTVDRATLFDARTIYSSPDGPTHPPLVHTGILLGELDGSEGPRTVFVSNVADGYSSMIYMVSKRVPGLHLAVEVSSLSCEYPRNALTAIVSKHETRVVYAMRDTSAWEFFERGAPLSFEDVNHYRARRKRDRLTPEIISEYLRKFGYGSLDKDFWISLEPAHLLCEQGFRLPKEFPK